MNGLDASLLIAQKMVDTSKRIAEATLLATAEGQHRAYVARRLAENGESVIDNAEYIEMSERMERLDAVQTRLDGLHEGLKRAHESLVSFLPGTLSLAAFDIIQDLLGEDIDPAEAYEH